MGSVVVVGIIVIAIVVTMLVRRRRGGRGARTTEGERGVRPASGERDGGGPSAAAQPAKQELGLLESKDLDGGVVGVKAHALL